MKLAGKLKQKNLDEGCAILLGSPTSAKSKVQAQRKEKKKNIKLFVWA